MSIHPQRWFPRLALLAAVSASVLSVTTVTAASLHTAPITLQNTAQAPRLVAQQSRIRRVRFAPGANSATIKDSVVSGTRDRYLLGARKGQTMSIRIVSLEDNAVFDVVAPLNAAKEQRLLKQEVRLWSTTLPETGDYQIVVGSTRGNASYRLQVTIR
ncbi:MAG: hypothetical protein RBJ76_12030 [Stenomitos frigidus ULC029]